MVAWSELNWLRIVSSGVVSGLREKRGISWPAELSSIILEDPCYLSLRKQQGLSDYNENALWISA
jgi:hypothetical protein